MNRINIFLKLFVLAFRYLFTGKTPLYLTKEVSVDFTNKGLTVEMKVKNMNFGRFGTWELWSVTFDGKKAKGYICGSEMT